MSSSRREQKVGQHCTHIHPLTVVTVGDFICNGCNNHGYGKTYCCANCDYHLHEYCATCPPTLLSYMHPQHELGLGKGPEHYCDICDESVEGLYYRCEGCDFDVHPLCTRLPQYVSHVPHPAHPLKLSHSGANNTCLVCRGAILSWRYACGSCGLDVHMECVDSSASASMGTHTNQGGDQLVPRHTKRKRMLRILKFITVEVVRHIITS